STKSSLGHLPAASRWTFDESVTDVFTDMLRRSIPQYDVMREAVFAIGKDFVKKGTRIVDLGCARGDALLDFIEAYGPENTYVGIDVSEPMLQAVRHRFAESIASGTASFLHTDLRT